MYDTYILRRAQKYGWECCLRPSDASKEYLSFETFALLLQLFPLGSGPHLFNEYYHTLLEALASARRARSVYRSCGIGGSSIPKVSSCEDYEYMCLIHARIGSRGYSHHLLHIINQSPLVLLRFSSGVPVTSKWRTNPENWRLCSSWYSLLDHDRRRVIPAIQTRIHISITLNIEQDFTDELTSLPWIVAYCIRKRSTRCTCLKIFLQDMNDDM